MMRAGVVALLCVFSGAALVACVERSEELTAAERGRVQAYVGTTPTEPSHPLDIAFGEGIELIGYDVSSEEWTPGSELRITWHWKVTSPPGPGWRLFTHLEGQGMEMSNHDGGGAVRRLYPPARWGAGEYIRDEQRVTLPANWGAAEAAFYLGFWRGSDRLAITRGPQDGDNRARAMTMPVTGGGRPAPTPPVATLRGGPLVSPIDLDGRAREPGWVGNRWSGLFVDSISAGEAPFEARVRVAYDDQALYVAFRVEDTDLQATYEDHDAHLWEEDCVEVFLDPDGDGRNYGEIQVSPRGVTFDTHYRSRRVPQPIGIVDWESGVEAAVHLRGTLNDSEVDEGYDVEMRIPFASFPGGAVERPTAARPWRMNFYVMNKGARGMQAAAFSPVLVPDFHVPDRFAQVTFRGRPAATPRPGAPVPGPSPAPTGTMTVPAP